MKTYCSECTKEIKESELSFSNHNGFLCWQCNTEIAGLIEYLIQLLANQE